MENKDKFDVNLMCKTIGVSRSGVYAFKTRKVSKRQEKQQALESKIKVLFNQSRQTYGSPRITKALNNEGVSCSENTVAKIMQKNQIISVHRKKFKPSLTDSNHTEPIAENILNQDFQATEPNQKWVGDITYIPTNEGFLYLAVIIDLFSRKVVGWATSSNPNAELVCRAFSMAVALRGKPKDLVYHSDRGVQYASFMFRRYLKAMGIKPSMSRRGNCYDNAVCESFFHTLKVELIHREQYINRESARINVADYINQFYNNWRIHSSLGLMSPVEFENNFKRKKASNG